MIRRILIVEPDAKAAQDTFHTFHSQHRRFERQRYETEIAGSVAEAIERMQTISYHCIIMDVNLPEMAGYEAVSLLKTIDNITPIIITADENTPDLEANVREQDIYYYHIRAFGEDDLILAVDSIFEESEKLRGRKKPGITSTKPILLKQLRLFQKQ
jgi:CheY-like chemotaxis protein